MERSNSLTILASEEIYQNLLPGGSDSLIEMRAQPDTSMNDHDLVEAVLVHGDEAAFRELYRRHTPRLLAFVTRLLARGDMEAEEVVQETWIRAFESLDRFQWKSSFLTWLTGIGLNRVRDRVRKIARSRTVQVDELPDTPVPPGHHETAIDLERLVARLPDDLRLVLVLHDVEGMKHREISERLDMPIGTSKTHLSNARKKLRASMTERGDNQ
jgi:RNA polymerase sigma factor (sigma-70 family)